MSAYNQTYLSIENIVKTFRTGESRVEVLRGVNLEIKRLETLAVVGASGVGKSTLLHILGALEPPTSGQVVLDGVNLYSQA